MLRKRILILCTLIFSMTLIFQVKSYTMAKVESSANMSVTSSENALIAIESPSLNINKIITENITTEIISDEEELSNYEIITEYTISDNDLQITNNTNETVDVTVSLEGNKVICLKDNDYEFKLSPGEFKEIFFELVNNVSNISDHMDIDIKIRASWEGGSADINDKIKISVNSMEPQINLYEIDLRTPSIEMLPEREEDITVENTDGSKNDTEIEADYTITDEIEDSVENNLIDYTVENKEESELETESGYSNITD